MKKYFLHFGLIFCWFLMLNSVVTAQETDNTQIGWPIQQQCLGNPTTPPIGWTFEGTIFTVGDGVHAIRADIPTPYYVAFGGDTEFGARGALSPDGRWFAVPAGWLGRGPSGSFFFNITEIRVYSTDGKRELYRVKGVGDSAQGLSMYYSVIPPMWINSESIIYYSSDDQSQYLVINPFTQEVTQWQKTIIRPVNFILSPDRTRAIYPTPGQTLGTVNWGLYDFATEELIASLPSRFDGIIVPSVDWTLDSSIFAALIINPTVEGVPPSAAVVLFDRDGQQHDILMKLSIQYTFLSAFLRFSPDGQFLAFGNGETDLFIADINNKKITAKCLDKGIDGLAWSPDGSQLAFTYNKNVVVLDLESNDLYTAAYDIGDVLDWKSGW